MVSTRTEVQEWLRDHKYKEFVSYADIREDIEAPKIRLGRTLNELTGDRWGGTPPQYENPYFSEEARRKHYQQ